MVGGANIQKPDHGSQLLFSYLGSFRNGSNFWCLGTGDDSAGWNLSVPVMVVKHKFHCNVSVPEFSKSIHCVLYKNGTAFSTISKSMAGAGGWTTGANTGLTTIITPSDRLVGRVYEDAGTHVVDQMNAYFEYIALA